MGLRLASILLAVLFLLALPAIVLVALSAVSLAVPQIRFSSEAVCESPYSVVSAYFAPICAVGGASLGECAGSAASTQQLYFALWELSNRQFSGEIPEDVSALLSRIQDAPPPLDREGFILCSQQGTIGDGLAAGLGL